MNCKVTKSDSGCKQMVKTEKAKARDSQNKNCICLKFLGYFVQNRIDVYLFIYLEEGSYLFCGKGTHLIRGRFNEMTH